MFEGQRSQLLYAESIFHTLGMVLRHVTDKMKQADIDEIWKRYLDSP